MNRLTQCLLFLSIPFAVFGCGKPAPKYDVSTPEAAVDTMLVGIAEANLKKIEAAATPHEKRESLASKILNGEELKEELKRLESQKVKQLKVGDEFETPDGESITIDDSMVGGDRVQVSKEGYPMPFAVVKVEGKWQVDTEAFIDSPNKNIGASGLPPIGPPGGRPAPRANDSADSDGGDKEAEGEAKDGGNEEAEPASESPEEADKQPEESGEKEAEEEKPASSEAEGEKEAEPTKEGDSADK